MSFVQRTFVLIKPDAISRGLVGEILTRIERKGLRVVSMDLRTIDRDLAQRHYAEHEGKHYYADVIDFITSAPVIAIVVEGEQAIEAMRNLVGSSYAVNAAPGTVRGDFALGTIENLVHASDSIESADREIGMWFPSQAQ